MNRKYTPPLPSYTFTKDGYAQMQEEERTLLTQRPHAISELQKARALGDLKENGYYQATRQKVNSIDHRLRQIKVYLKYGKIVESTGNDFVGIGNAVTVMVEGKELMLTIVGQHEANPKELKISARSPIGSALMGKKVGEIVIVAVPSGSKEYRIQKIQ